MKYSFNSNESYDDFLRRKSIHNYEKVKDKLMYSLGLIYDKIDNSDISLVKGHDGYNITIKGDLLHKLKLNKLIVRNRNNIFDFDDSQLVLIIRNNNICYVKDNVFEYNEGILIFLLNYFSNLEIDTEVEYYIFRNIVAENHFSFTEQHSQLLFEGYSEHSEISTEFVPTRKREVYISDNRFGCYEVAERKEEHHKYRQTMSKKVRRKLKLIEHLTGELE